MSNASTPSMFQTFTSFIEGNRRKELLQIYEDIIQKKLIELKKKKGGVFFDISTEGDSGQFVDFAFKRGVTCLSELYITAQFIVNGPKLCRPSDDDMFALEMVLPKIPFSVYHQPFPVFALEFPEAWRKARAINNVEPLGLILCHEPALQAIYSALVWQDGCCHVISLCPSNDNTLQEMLVQACRFDWEQSFPVTDDEKAVQESAARAALNYFLLLSDRGIMSRGYLNDSYANRLKRQMTRTGKRKRVELDSLPVLYEFSQKIRLFRREKGGEHQDDPTYHLAPHWRSGHWRMQACGPKLQNRKPLYIEPVLVNADSYRGKLSDTRVILEA